MKRSRDLDRSGAASLRPAKVAILASATVQVSQACLKVEAAAQGIALKPYFSPYGQMELQLFDPGSDLYKSAPEVVFIWVRFEEAFPACSERFLEQSPEDLEKVPSEWARRVRSWIEAVRGLSCAPILVANFAPSASLAAGLADARLPFSQATLVRRCNEALAEEVRKHPGVYVWDFEQLLFEIGRSAFVDRKMAYLGRIPFSFAGQVAFGKSLAHSLACLLLPRAKCLVLDLDNTLWGGVIGEEGLGGIALGEDYPGNVYKAFQRYLLNLKQRGILLAIASKNNEADAKEVFERHPDCLLKLSDFSAIRINWKEKSASIREIAAELNIGVDALVFCDDNPVEREAIRASVPAVRVLELPADPLGYIEVLEDTGLFDRVELSQEDRQRAQSYEEQRARKAAEVSFQSREAFLEGLEMVARIGRVDRETLPRVTQLLAKTNQFNLTTRRHSEAELSVMLQSGAVGLWLRLNDRFGDNGLTGVAVARAAERGSWVIDSFLLSCRIIGREAERLLLSRLIHEIRCVDSEAHHLLGEYVPTPKNGIVADFYSRAGFELVSENLWKFSLREGTLAAPSFITLQPE